VLSDGDRLVPLDGCVNFRDLGGYPARGGRRVRRGVLYRSDALYAMTEADVRQVRDALGVRAVIDLRSSEEVASDGVGPLAEPPVRRHHLPLFEREGLTVPDEGPRGLDEVYALMLRFARGPIARAVDLIAASAEPLVFHCAAGKDRTGLVAAVVLGSVGVADEHVIDDYAYTQRALERIVARLRASEGYRYIVDALPADTLHAEPETMARLLEHARREYGSLRDYALRAGVAESSLAALERRLLEAG
jgi:protein tyrosine/serine phosphatase